MTTPEQAAAMARALLRSKRANLCRHGVAYDHCAMCERPDDTTADLTTHPDPRALGDRPTSEETL